MSALTNILGLISGGGKLHLSDQLIFNRVIAFRGVTGGVGTSTIVQNVAYALAKKRKVRVCVIDTSFLSPTQHIMLGGKEGEKAKDYLEFRSELQEYSTPSKYKDIDVFYLHDRSIVDMIGDKDDSTIFKSFLNTLKSYYDIILIDINNEYTSLAMTAGVKANKIVLVSDESLKGIYHIQKAINTLGTLAIPFEKMSKIVLNKKVTNIVTPTAKTLSDSGLKVLGEIELSMELAGKGVTGEIIYESDKASPIVRSFNTVIDNIIEEIYTETSSDVKQKSRVIESIDQYNSTNNRRTEEISDLQGEEEIELIELDNKHTDNGVKTPTKPSTKPVINDDDIFSF